MEPAEASDQADAGQARDEGAEGDVYQQDDEAARHVQERTRAVVALVQALIEGGFVVGSVIHEFYELLHSESWAIQEPELPQVHAEAVGGEDYVETIRDVEADRVQEDTPLAREDARGGVGEAIGVAAGVIDPAGEVALAHSTKPGAQSGRGRGGC